jgi:hypothetical protein
MDMAAAQQQTLTEWVDALMMCCLVLLQPEMAGQQLSQFQN